MLEDQYRIRIDQRRRQHVACVFDGRWREDAQARNRRIPAFQ